MKKLLIILVLAFPSVAEAKYSPAKLASARAKASYQKTTHKYPLNWNTKCSLKPTQTWWRCTSQVWRGSYRGTFKILVKGNVARITSVGYVR